MAKNCENPLCPNEAVNELAFSGDKPPDERRALCAACQQAYAWGIQHDRMAPKSKKIWVVAVTDRGTVVHARAFSRKRQAVYGVAEYLRAQEGYDGPTDLPDICEWLAEHDERMGVEIFHASLLADVVLGE